MFDTGVLLDERAVRVVGAAWGVLPEDRDRRAAPLDDVVRFEDLVAWDLHPEDLPTGQMPPDDLLSTTPYLPPDERLGDDEALAPWQALAGIEDVVPDGMLALVLEHVDVQAVDDHLLVETVAAWQRVVAWAQLNSALAAAELSRRPAMNPRWLAPLPSSPDVAADELSMRLAWSRQSAARLVRDGRALENELLLTAEAVRDGRLDGAKLRTVCERLNARPGELAWAVQEAVLPNAATRTPTQLADDIDRALLAVDPQDAADRLVRATANRHVCHPKRLPDGMAGIWAVVPADDAAWIDATLEARARAERALGNPNTLDQIRADRFVELATGRALVAGPATVTDAPATGAPASGVPLSDAPASGVPVSGAPSSGVRIPKVRIDVTVALSTLMGLDELPAELAGFGPIHAEQARALAAGGVWRRLVTDPLSGRVLDVGRTRYRPPGPLAEHVTARDRVCARPGCSTPAHRCDLDHTTEYHGAPANGSAEQGTTCAGNLGPLSDRCHRLKTDGGFTLTQPEPGVFEWRTPAGFAYRVTPGDHGRAERLRPSAPNPGYPDEPPF